MSILDRVADAWITLERHVDDRRVTPPPPPLRSVYVSTTQGDLIRGALVESRADGLVLRGASLAMLQEGAQAPSWTPLDGDTVIPSEKVHYWQVLALEALS